MKFININTLKNLTPILCVWLFAIYPVLVLYAHNIEEVVLHQAILPLIFSLVFSTILFGLWRIILKNNIKAGLATVLLLLIFWYYGLIFMGITKFSSLKHWHLIPLLLFIYFHLVYLIAKTRQQKTLNNLNTILLLPISLLIVFNVITILPTEFKKFETLRNNHKVNPTAHEITAATDYPDIYLIILDEYASFKTIKEEWGYDNSEFAEFLKEKGFFVAKDSETRFPMTRRALPCLMNLEYLDGDYTDFECIQKYNNNFIFNFLDEMGYKVVFLDGFGRSQHTIKLENILHVYFQDINYKDTYRIDEFSDLVFNQSMLSLFINILKDENTNLYYHSNKYFFNYINNYPLIVNESKQPTFLYAHIMCPHLPYVFDRNGNFLENPTNYWEYKSLDKGVLKKLYLEQYIYVTKRITNIIDKILKTSENEPIIIIQSDHGTKEASAGIENAKQHYRVLNVVYFPGGNYQDLYSNIAPVNTLRVVLNKYFGKDYEMLEDR